MMVYFFEVFVAERGFLPFFEKTRDYLVNLRDYRVNPRDCRVNLRDYRVDLRDSRLKLRDSKKIKRRIGRFIVINLQKSSQDSGYHSGRGFS